MKQHLITGGAGFVGVNLARELLRRGDAVVAVDDLSRGKRELLSEFEPLEGFRFVEMDCRDADALAALMQGSDGAVDQVWHLAANSDIPAGVADPRIDLDRTFLTTFGVLEAVRQVGVSHLHFASSSAIYGDFGEREIQEEIGPLEPISNYGAMKLASEAQIRAVVEATGLCANVFRFPNVIGVPATHGVILDFVRKLITTPDSLDVLGDGTQQKGYLHVDDLIDAMLHVSHRDERWQVFNIGPSDAGVTVRFIAEAVRDRVSPQARIRYGTDARGWVGDVPRFRYSTAKLAATGWSPKAGSEAAVIRAVDEVARQELAA